MQKAFIETQFPIARLSAESFNERDAKNGQTLPRLGRWWGRKPLILVRACILGLLMPASDDPKKDRDIFLKILTMDDDGTWLRQKGNIPISALREAASSEIQDQFFGAKGFIRGLTYETKEELTRRIWSNLNSEQKSKLDSTRNRAIKDKKAFADLPYHERIKGRCERPENSMGPSEEAWNEINTHLNTSAKSLEDLVNELGSQIYGHTPKIGDAFCGGGSIPFEASRLGCNTYANDLNPIAGMLTWGSLNVLGANKGIQRKVTERLEEIYESANEEIEGWGIERNEHGERADAFLYCIEVKPDGCDYFIPLAPSWEVSGSQRVVVKWIRENDQPRLTPVVTKTTPEEYKNFKNKKHSTIFKGRIIDPFNEERTWSVESIRGQEGLRKWTKDDIINSTNDVIQERLYCIRWVSPKGGRRYASPTASDLEREAKVLQILHERFEAWQSSGFIPSMQIADGSNTDQPMRERGWTHWHHLFNPRQILTNSLLAQKSSELASTQLVRVSTMLALGKILNMNSRLCRWHVRYSAIDKGEDVF